MAMTMAPQQNSREDSNSHGSSHELDDSNTDSSSSRVRVADAGLRRAIESSSSSTEASTTSQDRYGQRRPRRKGRAADDVVRRSATFTRRHPSPERSPSPSPPTQESGEGENNKAGGAAIRRRKKCRPKHRCPTTNESISSILKPYPKYLPSSTILQSFSSEKAPDCDDDNHTCSLTSTSSATTTTTSSSSLTLKKPSRFLRRASSTQIEPSLPAASMHSFFLPPLNGKPLGKTQKRPSCDSLDQQWVPNGVDFSSSVEVHVFHVK